MIEIRLIWGLKASIQWTYRSLQSPVHSSLQPWTKRMIEQNISAKARTYASEVTVKRKGGQEADDVMSRLPISDAGLVGLRAGCRRAEISSLPPVTQSYVLELKARPTMLSATLPNGWSTIV